MRLPKVVLKYTGIPHFAPEMFRRIRLKTRSKPRRYKRPAAIIRRLRKYFPHEQ